MTLTLNLSDELEMELTAEARRLGLPLSEHARRLLAAGRAPGASLTTGPELVAFWQSEGVIGSRPDVSDSQQHARTIRRRAENR